ncbi:glycosyl hydrolase family 28-related protein [Sphingomonas flavalba]|uniref:glycosyl hydrolase family 28-related protein n=1 Tax=Sphingomonas flavalba TaxID=2559804 RepID=UPI0039E1E4A6
MTKNAITRRWAIGGMASATAAPAIAQTLSKNGGSLPAAWSGAPGAAVSVSELGLSGNGAPRDHETLQAAIETMSANGGGTLYFPDGTYNLGNRALVLRSGVSLIGNSGRTKLLYNGNGKAVMLDDRVGKHGDLRFTNFTIDGSGQDAFYCAVNNVKAYGGVNIDVSNINIKGKWNNGATYANLYGSSISRISTAGSHILNACHRILATINGMVMQNLYTGGSRDHKYCFYIDGNGQANPTGNLPQGHDNTLLGCVAQGGQYGFYVRQASSLNIINPYTEEVANPVVIGEMGAARTSNVAIYGGGLGHVTDPERPYFSQRGPRIHVENAQHTVIHGLDCLQSCSLIPLTFRGGGGRGARGWASVGKDGKVSHAIVTFPGSDYTSAPDVSETLSGSTYTAVLDGNAQVVRVIVRSVGTRLQTAAYPAAVTYGDGVQGLIIDAPYARLMRVDATQITDTIIPAIGRRASTSKASGGIIVTSDFLGSGTGEALDVRKVGGTGHRHFAYWRDESGVERGWIFEIPVVAEP